MAVRNEKFKDLIFYEIYPTSFYDSNGDGIGDLNGIKEKLPYIKELGCNAIWINPFFTSPFKDGGYDVADFFDVDPKFGTLADFDELVKEADKQGIKIVIDCVAGHASDENKDFLKSGEYEHNECSDLFIWNDNVWCLDEGYRLVSGRHPRNGNYLINFFSVQPAFNFGFYNVELPNWQMSYKDERTFKARDYIVDFMKFWLKRGAFGFRVDMAAYLVKNDPEKKATIEVWQYIFEKVRKEYPDAFVVSEWSNPEMSFTAGFDCDFVLDDWGNFYHRMVRNTEDSRGVAFLNGGGFEYIKKDLAWRYEQSVKLGGYLGMISGNHDTTRISNYLDTKRLKMYYAFMFMMPGIPFIYYGDEIQMKFADLPNKDGGYGRTGTRTPMQWNHEKNDGFSSCDESELYLPVNAANDITLEDNLKDKDSIYYAIKELIKLRKENPEILEKVMEFEENGRVVTLKRSTLKLVLNCSNEELTVDGTVLYTTGTGNTVKPYECIIVKNT